MSYDLNVKREELRKKYAESSRERRLNILKQLADRLHRNKQAAEMVRKSLEKQFTW